MWLDFKSQNNTVRVICTYKIGQLGIIMTDNSIANITNCINCNNQISEDFCPKCGQSAKLKRIDKHYVSHELLHLFHFEKGFFYTAKELFLRPGDSIKEFIEKIGTST